MSMKSKLLAAAVVMAFAATPGHAIVLALTLQGTVDNIADPTGLFSGASAGDAFTLVYRADFGRGVYGGGGGGFGSSVYLLGGSSLTNPDALISPISASLSVGGRSFDFTGSYYGQMSYTRNSFDIMFGGTGQSWAELIAQHEPGELGGDISTSINSDMWATFSGDIKEPRAIVIDGTNIVGASQFSYRGVIEGSGAIGIASGDLTPETYRVSLVPEPMSWTLMIGGFGLVGYALRRRASVVGLPQHG